jgi:uncharacterized protein
MRLNVRVIPRSSKNALSWEEEIVTVHLTAPPVNGAANEALIALLAKRLDLPKRAFQIIQGSTGRQKVVEIEGLTVEELKHKLSG